MRTGAFSIATIFLLLGTAAFGQKGDTGRAAKLAQAAALAKQGGAENLQKSFRIYDQLAGAGNAKAMGELGNCYANGLGVAKDSLKAAEWFRRGAAGGDARSMGGFGLCFAKGEGVPQDWKKAVEWYQKAYFAGDYSTATACLGDCYAKGQGVAQNWEKAVLWYFRGSGGAIPTP